MSAPSLEHIQPEFRELHTAYVRAIEVMERLLARGGQALRSTNAADLIHSYADLGHSLSGLMIELMELKETDPALYEAWRTASTLE